MYIKNKEHVIDGFTHFKSISTIVNSSTVSSHAVKVSFCRKGLPDYGLQLIDVQVKKKEKRSTYYLLQLIMLPIFYAIQQFTAQLSVF